MPDQGPLPSLVPLFSVQPCVWSIVTFFVPRPSSRVSCPFSASASRSCTLFFLINVRNCWSLLLVILWAWRKGVVDKRESWFTKHLLRGQGQHSSVLCPHVCLAGHLFNRQLGWEWWLWDPAKSASQWPGMPFSLHSARLPLNWMLLPSLTFTSSRRIPWPLPYITVNHQVHYFLGSSFSPTSLVNPITGTKKDLSN